MKQVWGIIKICMIFIMVIYDVNKALHYEDANEQFWYIVHMAWAFIFVYWSLDEIEKLQNK